MFPRVAPWLVVLVGCAELQPIELDRCGNEVLEPERGEDCDGYATQPGATCAAPREPHECRYVCSEPGTENGCPERWRCGTDGVCRQPAGALGEAEPIAQPGGQGLALADLDGDVHADLVVVDADRAIVAYLEEGERRQSFEIPLLAFGVPFIAEASGDAFLDLISPTADGLATLRGSPSRELLPTSYSSLPIEMVDKLLFFSIDLFPDLLLVNGAPRALPGREYLALTAVGLIGLSEGWEATHLELYDFDAAVPPAVGDFDELDTSPLLPLGSKTGEEFVMAMRGDSHVTLMRPQPVPGMQGPASVSANFMNKPPIVVSLDGRTVADGVIAVHLNPPADSSGNSAIVCPDTGMGVMPAPGDEHLDLLVDVADLGVEHRTLAAFGIGDGHFHSDPCTLGVAPPDDVAAEQDWLGCGVQLLTAGHLDGDAFVDIVTRDGAWLSSFLPSPTKYFCNVFIDPHVTTTAQFWKEARLGDFDGNGHMDLVAADRDGGLDVVLTSSESPPTITTVPTLVPASQVAVADVDGDSADDVVFIERFGEASDDALSVVFGQPFAKPLAPRTITSAAEILALTGYDQRRFSQNVSDGASELLIATRQDAEVRAAILWGRTDRQIYAPLLFSFGLMTQPYVPLAAAVGNFEFDGDLATADHGLFGIGVGALGEVVMGGGVVVDENQIDMLPDHPSLPTADGTAGVVALAVDFVESGKDAPVILGWTQPLDDAPDAPRTMRIFAPSVSNGIWELPEQLVLDGVIPFGARDDSMFRPLDRLGDWSRQLAPSIQSCALDPTGLGTAVFVAVESVPCDQDKAGSTTAIYVLPAGVLASLAAGAPPASADVIIGRPPEGETVLAFACLQADLDVAEELAMVTLAPGVPACDASDPAEPPTANIYLTELDAAGFVPPRLLVTVDASDIPELAGGARVRPPLSGMAAGDADGNGIDDIAIATTSRTLLFRGQAVNP